MSVAVLFFGVAWMLSVYLKSPAVAATAAIGAGVVLTAAAGAAGEELRRIYGFDYEWPSILVTSFVVGALAFVVSTAHYLRRVRV